MRQLAMLLGLLLFLAAFASPTFAVLPPFSEWGTKGGPFNWTDELQGIGFPEEGVASPNAGRAIYKLPRYRTPAA